MGRPVASVSGGCRPGVLLPLPLFLERLPLLFMFIFEFFLRQYSAHGGAVATVAEEGEWEVASAQCVSISAAELDYSLPIGTSERR